MHGPLRSLWDEPRPPAPPRRVWRDWALVGVLGPLAVLEVSLRPDLSWLDASFLVTLGLVPTLLWRRTRPLAMVLVAFGISGLIPLFGGGDVPDAYTMVYLLLLPYALVRWGSGREAAGGLALVLAVTCASMVVNRSAPADLVGGFAALSVALALGAASRYRAGARLRELDQVKLLEREHLARDLHDTVAHHVSAMAIRAQAGLAVAEIRPEAAIEALRLIEAEAGRALGEMRAMVRVLRRPEPAELAPGRGLADLRQLEGSGRPPVRVEVEGDLDGIAPPVESAIYRLAQESVTNARRHARRATRIDVHVAADDASVRLRVSDDGDGGPPRQAASPGYGLTGMIERAGLLGGTCVAGPGPVRGWIVTAVLPRTGAAA
ncbi:sensor histidine kinase [Nonomuraea sp. NN258]|uniref:sensor histidine kinase n=1 Tax=Nonomuraea antri TaxID=2730852 RepID=UPI001569BB78|nr:histidine kinase [Nonomuraea antri]NRQ33774.1 sensor histidine kinase [Nonomuraea antri]